MAATVGGSADAHLADLLTLAYLSGPDGLARGLAEDLVWEHVLEDSPELAENAPAVDYRPGDDP